MNLGDLLATDLRDLFQSEYNQITADMVPVNRTIDYKTTAEGRRIFDLSSKLDIYDGPDDDSFRIGALDRMSMYADALHFSAAHNHQLNSISYIKAQEDLYKEALKLINNQVDNDD